MKKFKQIHDKYYLLLRYYALKYTDDNRDIANNIIYNVFVENIDEILNSTNVELFLFTATRSACYSHLRSLVRSEKTLNLISDIETRDISAEMVEANLINMIYEEIEKLSDKSKLIIKAYLKGEDIEDISKRFNISFQVAINLKNTPILRLPEVVKLLSN